MKLANHTERIQQHQNSNRKIIKKPGKSPEKAVDKKKIKMYNTKYSQSLRNKNLLRGII